MKIVLFQPQIPENTGNIARTCVATNTELVLVQPFGFSISDRRMKRAGLDYWGRLKLSVIDDLSSYLETLDAPFYFLSSHATTRYTDAGFTPSSCLIFGSETSGLPPFFRETYPDRFLTIPMAPSERCLNLASSAAIVLYEALRQTSFETVKKIPL